MGEPVRIIDLAHDMIRLSGLEPERDIPIVITGIRPGEKLHEGLFEDSEEVERTHHDEAACAPAARRSRPSGSTTELDAVERLANEGDEPAALERVRAMIANPRRADSEQPRRRSSRPEPVDTRQLAALCAVVERGSFSQAAESLGVTQSAVSQAVRALEQRLGVAPASIAAGRQAEPTPEGAPC